MQTEWQTQIRLIWLYTVCTDLSVQKPRVISVFIVKLLKIQTLEKLTVIILKFDLYIFFKECPKDTDRIANSVDTDQTAPIGAC